MTGVNWLLVGGLIVALIIVYVLNRGSKRRGK